MTKPIDWPGREGGWWWMRYRSRYSRFASALRRPTLVEVIDINGTRYVKGFEHRDHLSRADCRAIEAQFLPAEGPPNEWL